MTFKDDLRALVARHLDGLTETALDHARTDIQWALEEQAQYQSWLWDVEGRVEDAFECRQLNRDLQNPKPDRRKSWWRGKQLWAKGTVFLVRSKDHRLAQFSPPSFARDHWLLRVEDVPPEVIEAVNAASHQISLAEAVEHYDDALKRHEENSHD